MRPDAIVSRLPKTNEDLRFIQRVEDILSQALVLKLAVEALTVPVLPQRSRSDLLNLRAGFGDPFPQSPRNHLRTVVAADVVGDVSRRTPGRPRTSVRAWILVVWPPRDGPMTCALAPLSRHGQTCEPGRSGYRERPHRQPTRPWPTRSVSPFRSHAGTSD